MLPTAPGGPGSPLIPTAPVTINTVSCDLYIQIYFIIRLSQEGQIVIFINVGVGCKLSVESSC